MAGKRGRWNQALFQIDDRLLEQLIGDCRAGARDVEEDQTSDDDELEAAADVGERMLWYLEEGLTETVSGDTGKDDAAEAALAGDDVHAVNMRVLEDYLRRRCGEGPHAFLPTLH